MTRIEILQLPRSRYSEALALYEKCGYTRGLADRDYVVAAARAEVLVGVVRLCPEHDTTVLRGMQVLPAHRRQGIGGRLLEACTAQLGSSACYCLPWSSLERFYARGGFGPCPPEMAPRFLVDRYTAYRSEGHDVILLWRA